MKGQESNDLRASRKDQGRDEEQIVLSRRDILDLRLALRRVGTMLDQLNPLMEALALAYVYEVIHRIICDDPLCVQNGPVDREET